MSLSKYRDKKVLVMGLGLNGGGVESARFFYHLGAIVTVTDLQSENILKPSIANLTNDCPNIVYHLGGHIEEDFRHADYVIKNPGVPPHSQYLQIAKDSNAVITSDLEVFLQNARPHKIVGVTGTKGKSTTSTYISQILSDLDCPNILSGNIGKSPLNSLGEESGKVVIIELSSFQIDDLGDESEYFDVIVYTSLFPDHLNRYITFENYKNSKLRLLRYLKRTGIVIYPQKNFEFLPKTPHRALSFGSDLANPIKNITTPENKLNLNAAVLTVSVLTGKTCPEILGYIKNLSAPRFRNQFVRSLSKVNFYNDSTATNPTVTIKTLRNYPPQNTIVILGGSDKNLSIDELSDFINTQKIQILILITPVGQILKTQISPNLVIAESDNLKLLVQKGYDLLRKKNGGNLLLSPAAASFGMFLNEFDRGEQFNQIVRNLDKK